MGSVILKNCSSGGTPKTPEIFRDVVENISPYTITANDLKGLKSIKSSGFYKRTLKSVTTPSSVRSFQSPTFLECDNLDEVKISKGDVSTSGMFNSCSALTCISLSPEVSRFRYNSAVYMCPSVSQVNFEGGVDMWCSNVELDEALPDNFLYIGNYPIGSTLYIGSSVSSIKRYAFAGCTNLEEIHIPKSNISGDAFEGCSSLSSIYFWGTLKEWCEQSNAFLTCNNLPKHLYVDESTGSPVKIENTLVIPDDVSSISSYSFMGCSDITDISFTSEVTHISAFAFQNCLGLTSVTIPSTLTWLSSSVFRGCSNLTSITLQEGMSTIEDYAFAETGIASLVLPSTIDLLRSEFIYGCPNLTSITMPVENNKYKVYDNCIIRKNGYSIGSSNYDLIVTGSAPTINYEQGVSTSYSIVDERAFIGCPVLTEAYLYGTEKVLSSAFRDCANLEKVVMGSMGDGGFYPPIGDYAFQNCPNIRYIEGRDSNQGTTNYKNVEHIKKVAQNCGSTNYKIKYSTAGNDTLGGFSNLSGMTEAEINYEYSNFSIGTHAFSSCTRLAKLSFTTRKPTSVGASAFNGDVRLYDIGDSFDSITSIGAYAFQGCGSLPTFTVGSNVTSIGNYAFSGDENLIEIYNKSSLNIVAGSSSYGEIAYYAKNVYTDPANSKLSTSDDFIFYIDGATKIAVLYVGTSPNVVIPSGTTEIYNGTFRQRDDITSITIPSTVTTISSNAAYGCSNLRMISGSAANCKKIGSISQSSSYTINVNVGTSIGYNVLTSMTGLTGLIIGSTITSLSSGIGSNCSNLASIEVDSNNTTYSSVSNCVINNSHKLIFGCKSSIIPNDGSVTSIGDMAFYYCLSLASIEIPSTITSIGNSAFAGCSALTTIEIPGTVSTINQYTFSSCTNLTQATLLSGVTTIGGSAFGNCSSLYRVYLPNTVTSIGASAFSYCSNLTQIYYDGTIAEWGSITLTSGWDTGTSNYTIYCSDGTIAKDGTITYYPTPGLGYELNDVEVSYSCTGIGISTDTDIIIASTYNNVPVTSIQNSAFENCTTLTSIIIQNTTVSIGYYAFYNCTGLTSITIPSSVTRIENHTFYNCTGLTSIIFNGTMSQWNSITFGTYWNYNTGNYVIHCTDGDIPKTV